MDMAKSCDCFSQHLIAHGNGLLLENGTCSDVYCTVCQLVLRYI